MLDTMIPEVFTSARLSNLYERLRSSGLDLTKYECLFLPYVGPYYRKATTKILYVGRDSGENGEGDLGHLSDVVSLNAEAQQLAKITSNFIENSAIPYYAGGPGYSGPFPRMIYTFTAGILTGSAEIPDASEKSKELSELAFRSMSWTNLFKVGRPGWKRLEKPIRELLFKEFNTLKQEIEALEPDLVILTTGHDYDEYLERTFGHIEFNQLTSQLPQQDAAIVYGNHCDNSTVFIRTRHPRGWSNKSLAILYNCVYDIVRRG